MTLKRALKCVALLAVGFLAAQVCAEETPVLKTQNDRLNYGMGVNVMRNFKQQGMEIDLDVIVKGMKDALSGERLLMTEEDIKKTLNTFQAELRWKQKRVVRIAAENNMREGTSFLVKNRNKEGVVERTSGLQYKILRAGTGKKPADLDTVEVNYRGTLIDGTEILNTYKGGQTAIFKVTETIPGLTEALKLMPVGSKWQLFIPSPLAYGDKGMGRFIGANAMLIYEVELLAIK